MCNASTTLAIMWSVYTAEEKDAAIDLLSADIPLSLCYAHTQLGAWAAAVVFGVTNHTMKLLLTAT